FLLYAVYPLRTFTFLFLFLSRSRAHRYLHSFPTRRSSDLPSPFDYAANIHRSQSKGNTCGSGGHTPDGRIYFFSCTVLRAASAVFACVSARFFGGRGGVKNAWAAPVNPACARPEWGKAQ